MTAAAEFRQQTAEHLELDFAHALEQLQPYVRRQQLAPNVAKATVERECCDRGIPSFALQVDAKSPYSMTSKEGLAAKLNLAIQALHAMKAISEPIPLSVIQDAVDPTYLREYMTSIGK